MEHVHGVLKLWACCKARVLKSFEIEAMFQSPSNKEF